MSVEKVLVTKSSLEAIGDSIRAKLGVVTEYKPAEMSGAIANITTGVNIPVLLTVTTPPTKTSYNVNDSLDLTGIVVTATYADGTMADVTSSCTFSPANGTTLATAGTQTITATYTLTDTSSGHNYTLTLTATTTVTVTQALAIVSWASGTDAEIGAMIDAAHNGTIDLQQDGGWAVGDVRTITVESFIDGAGTTHPQQSIDIVITSFDSYMNCGNVMQFDFKDSLQSEVRVNSTRTNAGGYGSSEMKTTTIPALVNALPLWLKSRLIEFSVLASGGSMSSTIETVTGNKLALRSEIEVFNATSYSETGEGTHLTYYSTVDDRKKKKGHNGTDVSWWLRSPNVSSSRNFVITNGDGSGPNTVYANNAHGLAPFGCL